MRTVNDQPASTYIARGEPASQFAWRALWALPGLVPREILNENGAVRLYSSEGDAETGAVWTIYNALRKRAETRYRTGPSGYFDHMSPEEFATALATLGIGPAEFGRLWGSKPSRIADWIAGSQLPSFPLWWVFPLLGQAGNLKAAVDIVGLHTRKKQRDATDSETSDKKSTEIVNG